MKRRSIYLLAATLAATITLAFLAGCSSGRGDATAQRSVAVNAISPHLPFGNPSEAGGVPNNELILRAQFAASWNAKKRIANWVAWRLVADDIGDTERSQFYADPEISTPTPKDYEAMINTDNAPSKRSADATAPFAPKARENPNEDAERVQTAVLPSFWCKRRSGVRTSLARRVVSIDHCFRFHL